MKDEILKFNSNSMKTIVETFLTEETVDLIYDNEQLDKWNKHVDELGLKGQTQIVKKDKSPIPFMHLKKSYIDICEMLCPRKVDVEQYNITPIPVEILELIALSKKENYFSRIQIWYDDKSPDPFAVGVKENLYSYMYKEGNSGSSDKIICLNLQEQQENKKKSNHYFSGTEITGLYLIGKWADVKQSWDELKERAIKRFKASKENEYQKQIKEAKRGLEDLETEAFDKFN